MGGEFQTPLNQPVQMTWTTQAPKFNRTHINTNRCQRLSLPCVEQVRKQGRPTTQERQHYLQQQGQAALAAAAAAGVGPGGEMVGLVSGGGGNGTGGSMMDAPMPFDHGTTAAAAALLGRAPHPPAHRPPSTATAATAAFSNSTLGAYPGAARAALHAAAVAGAAIADAEHLEEIEDPVARAAAAESLAGSLAAAGARECGPQLVGEFVLAAFERLRRAGQVDVPRTLAVL